MYRILVVDSSAIDRRMMHDVLEKKFSSSVELLSAAEGPEAAELVKNGDIDLLIVNIPYFIPSIPISPRCWSTARAT